MSSGADASRADANPALSKWSATVCGEAFQAAFHCFHASTSSIKGIDCAALINAYADCCKENEGACHPSMSQDEDEDENDASS